ncbi:MAG: hypothetical protein O7G85_11975, partial [Planctomycetota bacterium]|nr:hypothetical protein [Planctomycetota bacterium]
MEPTTTTTNPDQSQLDGCSLVPLRYAGTIFVCTNWWIFFYDPGMPQQVMASVSLLMQNAIVVGLFLSLDSVLKRPALRFILAGLIAVYAALCITDLLLLQLISTPLAQIVSIMLATGSPITAWTWAELTLLHALLLVGVFILAFIMGGTLHRVMPRFAMIAKNTRRFHVLMIVLLVAYVGEQVMARTSSAYINRTSTMPLYVRVLPAATGNAYTIRLLQPPTEAERRRALEA